MSFFKSLPDDAGVRHILTLKPRAGRALVEFHTAALHEAVLTAFLGAASPSALRA
jgi:hypothetical protein